MPLLELVLLLILIGVGLYLINKYVPMAELIKTILNVVVIIAVVIFILQLFGLFSDIRVGS